MFPCSMAAGRCGRILSEVAVVSASSQNDSATLITGAAPSYEEEHASRVRKYTVMMALRLPCLILAGVFYHTWWLALAFIAVSIPLPWIAVLVANDAPPRKTEKVNRYKPEPKTLEKDEHQVIEG